MAVTELLLAVLLQSCFELPQVLGHCLDVATQERMAQGARNLREQVTRLGRGLEQAAFAWAAPILPALQQWQVLATAAILLLLVGLCCWLRRRCRQPAGSSKDGVSRSKADLEEKSSVALAGRSIPAQRLLDLSESFMKVEELVDDLLRICQKLSRNSFMPRLRPVVGVSSTLRGWSPCEEDAIYRLLVPLSPPRGHVFDLEMGTTTKDMPARKSSLRVKLQCTCTREQLPGDMLCFLHHPQKELREKQGPSLLGVLCTGPYLDMEKTTRWLQILLKRAWAAMPQSTHCRLTVLPSRHSCNLRLTDASGSTVLIELVFGVKQDDSYVFLS
ncbi:inositol 1,4,5-trisphosphate receptor-interacting protein-like 1 [Numenius arquata]|uniref:inositol 1,4,5-trisphosphate receptor-interacting protein-like 1 n=1 Tax=Numenius arquata TaxID=31919 RepID=UPI003D304EC3